MGTGEGAVMLNPYVILGLLLFWCASVTGAFFSGQSSEADRAKAAQLAAVNQAVEDANRVAAADQRKAVAAAIKTAKARTRTVTIRGKAVEVIREVPSPAACDWNPDSWGVLLSAVDAANDKPASVGSLPQPLPRAGAAGKSDR